MMSATKLQPIWVKSERFFLFPLQPSLATVISLLACTPLWLTTIDNKILLGILCALFVSIATAVLFATLEHAMQGSFSPPQFTKKISRDYASVLLQQSGLMILFIAILYFGQQQFGQSFFYVFGTLLTFCYPAILMIFSATRQLSEALNPLKITEFILQLGHSYFVLLGIIYLLAGGLIFSYNQLILYLPWIVAIHWITFISSFICLSLFHMMGYVIYLNHETLNHSSIHIDNSLVETTHPLIAEIKLLIRSEQHDEAQALLKNALIDEPYNIDFNDMYHKLCLIQGHPVPLEEHCNLYLKFLLQKGYHGKALEIFLAVFNHHKNYRMNDMEDIIKMAKILQDAREYSIIIRFLDGLHHRHPEHRLIPKAYGFLAKVLHEQFGRDKQAVSILEYILVMYPDHPIKYAVKDQIDKIAKCQSILKK